MIQGLASVLFVLLIAAPFAAATPQTCMLIQQRFPDGSIAYTCQGSCNSGECQPMAVPPGFLECWCNGVQNRDVCSGTYAQLQQVSCDRNFACPNAPSGRAQKCEINPDTVALPPPGGVFWKPACRCDI